MVENRDSGESDRTGEARGGAEADLARLLERAAERLRGRRVSGTERLLSRALSIDPASSEAFNLLGVLHELEGKPLEAQKHYRAALSFHFYVPADRNLERLVMKEEPGEPIVAEDDEGRLIRVEAEAEGT